MPFPMLHQVFVLHAPSYECVHPENFSARNFGMNDSAWQVRPSFVRSICYQNIFQEIFIPVEFSAATHTMAPSECNYLSYGESDIDYIMESWPDIVQNKDNVTDLQVTLEC